MPYGVAKLTWDIMSFALFIFTCVAIVTAQLQNMTRTGNPGTLSRQRASLPQQRRGNDVQRGGIVQMRRSRPQRRPILNLQNLSQATGTIPRARSFQAGLPNTIPRMDPRTGMALRGTRGTRARSPSNRIGISGSRLPPQLSNLNSICAQPRSVRCYSWPRNRDSRDAYICDGRCQTRSCSVPCECSCVDPRLLGRLRAVGRISGPELIPVDSRLTDMARRQHMRNRILALRAARRRQLPVQPGTSPNRGVLTNGRNQQNSNVDLNFGISDDVLATLIAQPVLNEIVGPQGINQILAGEPPPLLTRENRGQSSMSPSAANEITQPDSRAVRTPNARAQPRIELAAQDKSMGIPVPLSRINFSPGSEMNPAMGDMRVMMSDITPFEDPMAGLNIDLPNPTPVGMNMPPAATDNQVSVSQLPGTGVLFVDLTRSSPNGQIGRVSDQRRITPLNNMTSADLRSRIGNNVLLASTNQTLPGSVGIRPPTTDECLAQRMELWCDPQKPWDGTPGLSRWCLLNCRADNCDNQRCACACIDEILFKTKYEQLHLRAP